MTTFTIEADNNITAHATADEAVAAVKAAGVQSFTNQQELAELAAAWPAGRLVEIWSSLPGATEVTKLGRKPGNYALFAGAIEDWFFDPAIMALDEYGIPVQVGQRLQQVLRPEGSLDNAIKQFRALDLAKLTLSDFERDLLKDARAHL